MTFVFRKSSKKILISLLWLFSLIIVGGGCFLVASTREKAQISSGIIEKDKVKAGDICDKDLVNKYNPIYLSDSEPYSPLKSLKDDIIKKDKYSEDANCVLMLLNIYRKVNLQDEEVQAYKKLVSLADSGNNPSVYIRGIGHVIYLRPRKDY